MENADYGYSYFSYCFYHEGPFIFFSYHKKSEDEDGDLDDKDSKRWPITDLPHSLSSQHRF